MKTDQVSCGAVTLACDGQVASDAFSFRQITRSLCILGLELRV